MFPNHDVDFYVHLYVLYVRSALESCTLVWSPKLIYQINRIESVQRYFTWKILSDDKKYTDKPAFVGLKSLEERRICFDVKLLHKIYFHSNYNFL